MTAFLILDSGVQNESFLFWKVLIVLLLILVAVMIFRLIKHIKKSESMFEKINERIDRRVKSDELNSRVKDFYAKLKKDESPKTIKEDKVENEVEIEKNNFEEDEISKPIFLNPEMPTKEEPNYFYAGIPTPEGEFKSISGEIDESQTIFKLTYVNEERTQAEFEVSTTDYLLKMIVNQPDDYLFRVCNPKNSNREFKRRINTIKKGEASLINGVWTVREEDKAVIEFI